MATKYGKTAPQITLRWAVQLGIAIIPKSIKVERMVENRSLFDFELT
jgi:diketogulonate reductase-like aldo/keto reductase